MAIVIDFDTVRNKLSSLQKKVENQVIEKALEAGAEIVQKEIKEYAPVKTGHLRDSIGVINTIGKGKYKRIQIGIATRNRDVILRGFYNEYGTRGIIGNRWMKRGFNSAYPRATKAIIKSIQESLKV